MLGRPTRDSPMATRSATSIAAAALRHLPSLGKSRKAVLTATPPVTEPLNTKVVKIKVHIDLTPEREGLPKLRWAMGACGHACSQSDTSDAT
jgi:hypothetical protein